jgi:alkylation response protein AidB-like acyl-CoA dehydrogenase
VASSSSSSSLAAGIGFELSPEQRQLRELAHDFAERELRPIAREWDEREDCPSELLGKAAALGLTSHAIPGEYGGGGVAAVTSSLIAEELSWGCAGLAAPIGATMFPVRPLLRSGTEEQKQRWLPRLASEEGCLAAIAFTEPGAGSDVSGIEATARRDGDDYVVSGEKCYVTNGGIAELTIVFAKLDGAITAFLVEAGDPGVSAGRKEPKLGLRSSYTGSIVFDEARLPADRLLGEEGEGFAIAMDFFMHSRPQVAASAVGIARAAFEYATDYANERRAFGKPLIAKQGVSFKLADMAMQVEASRLLVWRAAAALDTGSGSAASGSAAEDPGLLGSYAKGFAADVAMSVTTDAVQVLGGAGIMRDHPVEKWMRDAKVLQIVEGTSEIQRHVITQYLRR